MNASEAELCLTVKLYMMMMFIVLTVTVEVSVMNHREKVTERREGSWEVNMSQTADLR